MCQRGWSYIVKAGTVILVCNFAVYMMQTYGWNLQPVDDPANSILATVATPIAYVIAPVVGVALWQLAAAAVTGFIAKECVVSTLATVFMFEHLINEDLEAVGAIGATQMGGISVVAGLAFLMFNLFTPPCFAAIGAMNSEIKSKKWLWAGIGLQFAVGYTVGFLVFFFGTLFTGGSFGEAWMPIVGWAIVAAITAIYATVIIVNNKKSAKALATKSTSKEKVGV
jgi:ferrous iron transport protein B